MNQSQPTLPSILITGGTGIVGSHLLLQLAREGYVIRATYRSKESLLRVERLFHREGQTALVSAIQWVKADICNTEELADAMKGIRQVYHAAAMVSFDPNDRKKLMKNNVEGTANVVNLCLDLGIEKLCYVSSTAAAGRKPEPGQPFISEACPWEYNKHTSSYAVSKHLAEQEVWRGVAEGLSAVIVNPCLIVGAGNWGNSSTSLFTQVKSGMPFYTSGENAYVDARDVVNAMVQLMESDITAQRFLLVGENRKLKEVFDWTAHALHVSAPRWKANRLMASLAWRVEQFRSLLSKRKPLVTRETAHAAFEKRAYSNKKIIDAIGIQFTPIKEAIEHTAQAFRDDLQLKEAVQH